MKKRDDRASARPSISRDVSDLTAGDEGLEENLSAASSELEDERMEGGSREHSSNVGSADVRADNSIARTGGRERTVNPATGFEGQGGQKGGNRGSEQGTGYVADRSGQLQDDGSLSGNQGTHGKSGSRRGKTGSSRSDRAGGETAQNPRDIDRSRM